MTDLKAVEISAETMTSTQLAEMLNKQKKEINRKIKLMFQDKIDGGVIRPSLDARGYVAEYHVPELEAKMFVAKNDISYLEKITQYWIDKGVKSKPLTGIEMARQNLALWEDLEASKSRVKRLETTLDEAHDWASVKYMEAKHKTQYSWQALKKYSLANNFEIKKVFDQNYGTVNSYHTDVWLAVYNIDRN